MNALKNTTDKIVAVLSSAVATNQISIVASWHDITAAPSYAAGSVGTVSNDTTQVDVVPAPTSGAQRVIDAINIHNTDTAGVIVAVSYSDNGTIRPLWRFALEPGGFATHTRGGGFGVFDSSGRTITAGAPGSAGVDGADGLISVQEAEIDFGPVAVRSKTFTVTDAGVSPASRIVAVQSGAAATGRSADENEGDALVLRCVPGAGSFTLYTTAIEGPVAGKFKINYVFS